MSACSGLAMRGFFGELRARVAEAHQRYLASDAINALVSLGLILKSCFCVSPLHK